MELGATGRRVARGCLRSLCLIFEWVAPLFGVGSNAWGGLLRLTLGAMGCVRPGRAQGVGGWGGLAHQGHFRSGVCFEGGAFDLSWCAVGWDSVQVLHKEQECTGSWNVDTGLFWEAATCVSPLLQGHPNCAHEPHVATDWI